MGGMARGDLGRRGSERLGVGVETREAKEGLGEGLGFESLRLVLVWVVLMLARSTSSSTRPLLWLPLSPSCHSGG